MKLLFLGRPDELDRRSADGMVTVPMACESEGALEIFIEPMLPHPQIVVIGRSLAVFALTKLARALDWEVAVERANNAQCTYWITVRNLTNAPVTFEGRYAVLS